MVFNKDCLVGLTIDEKYEIQEYRDMMKAFSDAATVGDLDQVTITYFPSIDSLMRFSNHLKSIHLFTSLAW